jgi:ABC-2 type transport system permease protein
VTRPGSRPRSSTAGYAICFAGIGIREFLRFLHQKERLLAALVRPLVWLVIFAGAFRSVLGVSIIPPYQTYVLYDVYVTPGLIAMIQLFNGMQSSLSLVYDREIGSMRVLLTSPFPRPWLLFAKLCAGTFVSLLQVYLFLMVARWWGIAPPWAGYAFALPTLILSGLMFGSIGLFISSLVPQLENFASMMNFVIFPMFFTSSALYPLWRVREGSETLYVLCRLNPLTHAVELIRYGLYLSANPLAALIVAGTAAAFFALSSLTYHPAWSGIRGG